jgi:uncharacterized membrane protein
MSSRRLLGGTAICLAGAVSAVPIAFGMAGFGICEISLSISLVGSVAVEGAIVAGTVAALWRNGWWAGALSFSVTLCLGLLFATQGARIASILLCIVITILVAFVVRYPGPNSLK